MFRFFLTTSSALGLLATAAVAGSENAAFLEQLGSGNAAQVTQSGDNNDFGNGPNVATQAGDSNDFNITQSGDFNQVGTSTFGSAPGVDQMGDRNQLAVSQSSDHNFINVVQQTGIVGASATSNSLTITQGASHASYPTQSGPRWGNVVSRVEQVNTGSGTSAAETNTVTIFQDRSTAGGPFGLGPNTIGAPVGLNYADRFRRTGLGVYQKGTGHMAALYQSGERNTIRTVKQFGVKNQASVKQLQIDPVSANDGNNVTFVFQTSFGYTRGNTARVWQEGRRNGRSSFTTGGYAAAPGIGNAMIRQIGADNFIDYKAVGDDNKFGFHQYGTGNSVGLATFIGNSNELGAAQNGADNQLLLTPVVGDNNNIGLSQSGTANLTTIALASGSNANALSSWQTGTSTARLTIAGDNNLADVTQIGRNTGAGFGVTLKITGNSNGRGVLAGNAGTLGLFSGRVRQDGNDNAFSASITGIDNQYAAAQFGNDNAITASVFGDENDHAIRQNGNGNSAALGQNGFNNTAGIIQ